MPAPAAAPVARTDSCPAAAPATPGGRSRICEIANGRHFLPRSLLGFPHHFVDIGKNVNKATHGHHQAMKLLK